MSEPQKVFASVSGAFAAHVLLLILVFVLLNTRSVGSALRDPSELPASNPQEVVILMSDLIEQIELEDEEERNLPRPFMDTDLNAPESDVPEDAKFESDRNTSAASELAPNPNQPRDDLPTTRGNSLLPYFELQNRKYTDGELDQPPASEGTAQVVSPNAGATALPHSPASADSDAAPGEENANGDSEEAIEGVDTPPENDVAEVMARPEESPTEGESETSTMLNSFNDPNSNTESLAFGELGAADQFAANQPEPDAEAEIGEMRDLEQSSEKKPGGTGVDFENSEATQANEAVNEENINLADVGLFASGYNPNALQKDNNGGIDEVGQNAVDAMKTVRGAYIKKVQDRIGKEWHFESRTASPGSMPGHVKLELRIDSSGNFADIRIIDITAPAPATSWTLRAIKRTKLPKMPEDLARQVGPFGVTLVYTFHIH